MHEIDINQTIFSITEKFPETIDVFVSQGFPRMGDYTQRAGYGKLVTLKTALELKGLNSDIFVKLLNEAVSEHRNSADITLNAAGSSADGTAEENLRVTGLLPCPVRIPMMEEFTRFCRSLETEKGFRIDAELKAASTGTQWVEEHIGSNPALESLPDLFISAGFDLFFDRKRIGSLREQNAFADLLQWQTINSSFADLDLQDPQGVYSVLATVPAIFLVNGQELGDRPVPRSWKDLLSDEFANSVSLPVGDFDLFNAILLTLGNRYGEDAVGQLGRVMLQAMHPSQMVKSDRLKNQRPAVTIMPYFFTKTVRNGGPLQAVWPEDGAIISPIFMLAKKSMQKQLQPLVDFFGSKQIGTILAQQGLFPSLHPDVTNELPQKSPFMWLGWDHIKSHDLSMEISRYEELFNRSAPREFQEAL